MNEKIESSIFLNKDEEDEEKDAEEWKRLADDGDALISELEDNEVLPKPEFGPGAKTDVGGRTEKIEPTKKKTESHIDPEDNDSPAWQNDEDEAEETDALLSALNNRH